MMSRTTIEISISTTICGELRQASAEVEVPDGTSWDAAVELTSAFSLAYARLWAVPPRDVHATAAFVQTTRAVVRYGDISCMHEVTTSYPGKPRPGADPALPAPPVKKK